MKKPLKALLGIIPLLVVGYFFLPHINGNSDAMMTYLEETDKFAISYNEIIEQEWAIEDEEELLVFTQEVSIPKMEKLLSDAEVYGQGISKNKLKAVHDIYNSSISKRIEADKAWVKGDLPDIEALYEEADSLYIQYEEELEKLANKWAVEIVWEDKGENE
ncbi:hypothetical protein ACWE42_15840 [Sutcliffiella cohnii]